MQTLIRHQQSHAKNQTPAVSGQRTLTGYFHKNRVSPDIRDSTSKACLFMITKDLQQFTIVDDVGFRSLAQHFMILGATLAKNHLLKAYDECVASIRKELNRVAYVSVTS